jgi:hypothetical protein
MLPTGLFVLAAGALVLAGCGDDRNPVAVASPTPPPTPPPPRALLQNGGALRNGFARGDFFTSDRAGTLDATVDYTFANSSIVVWIARGQCTQAQFGANSCEYAATSFAGAKPRRVSVTNAPAATYTLIVGNLGPQDESVAFQVVLTPSAAGATRAQAGGQPSEPGWQVRLPR